MDDNVATHVRTVSKLLHRHSASIAWVTGFHHELRSFMISVISRYDEPCFRFGNIGAVNIMYLCRKLDEGNRMKTGQKRKTET